MTPVRLDPRPFGLESSTLSLSHCAPIAIEEKIVCRVDVEEKLSTSRYGREMVYKVDNGRKNSLHTRYRVKIVYKVDIEEINCLQSRNGKEQKMVNKVDLEEKIFYIVDMEEKIVYTVDMERK